MKKLLTILFFIPTIAFAVNVTIPQATQRGVLPVGNANGTYSPTTTVPKLTIGEGNSDTAQLLVASSTGTGNNPVTLLNSLANRPTLQVKNQDGTASTYVLFDVNGDNTSDIAFGSSYLNEVYNRFVFDLNGKMGWGSGSGARDTFLYRNGVNSLKTDGDFTIGSLTGLLRADNGLISTTSTSTGLGMTTSVIPEGSNLYWTNDRFDTRLAASSTIARTDKNNTFSGIQTFNTVRTNELFASYLDTIVAVANGSIIGSTTPTNAYLQFQTQAGTGTMTYLHNGQYWDFDKNLQVPKITATASSSLGNASTTNLTNSGWTVLTGNVGVGLSNPTQKLQVAGNITAGYSGEGVDRSVSVFGTGASGAANTAMYQIGTDGYLHSGYGDLIIEAGDDLIFKTWGGSAYTEHMRITPTGNVGIGRIGPGEKLDVNGNIKFGNDSNGTAYLASGYVGDEIGMVGDGDDYIAVKSAGDGSYRYGNNNLIVSNAGKVGIGTSLAPATKLEVNHGGVTNGAVRFDTGGTDLTQSLDFYDDGGKQLSIVSDQAYGYQSIDTNGYLLVRNIGGTEKFRFDTTTGNFGVGTSTLASALTAFKNSASFTGMLGMTNPHATGIPYMSIGKESTNANSLVMGWDNANQVGGLWVWGNSLATGLSMKSSGNVGIGSTTPLSTLSVTGKAGTNPFTIASSSGAVMISLSTAGTLDNSAAVPMQFTNTGSGSYNKSVIYADAANGFYIDRALVSDSFGANAHPFSIGRRGQNPDLRIDSVGNVGISTTTPVGKLSTVSTNSTNAVQIPFNDSSYIYNSGTYNSGGSPSSLYYRGYYSEVNLSNTFAASFNDYIQNAYGIDTNVVASPADLNDGIQNLYGGNFYAKFSGAKNDLDGVLTVYGVRGVADFTGTNTGGGPITSYGGYFSAIGDATTNGATNKYGLYSTVSGSADNNYGIYLTASGATNNYAIYSNSGTNYFAGNVGIGSTTPSSLLSLGSSASASTTITVVGKLQITNINGSTYSCVFWTGSAWQSKTGACTP